MQAPICPSPLDCDERDCDPYEPKSTRCDYMPGYWFARYDGECGEYRYRFDGGMFSGTIWIWDRATGELVTLYSFTDSPFVSCQRRLYGDLAAYEQCEVAYGADVCTASDADAGTDLDAGR